MWYRSLRCAAYETLNVWMQSIGSSCGTEMFAGDVIQHCLTDCAPCADSLKVVHVWCLCFKQSAF